MTDPVVTDDHQKTLEFIETPDWPKLSWVVVVK